MLNSTLVVPDAVGLSAALDMSGYDIDSPFALQLLNATGTGDAVSVWLTDAAAAIGFPLMVGSRITGFVMGRLFSGKTGIGSEYTLSAPY